MYSINYEGVLCVISENAGTPQMLLCGANAARRVKQPIKMTKLSMISKLINTRCFRKDDCFVCVLLPCRLGVSLRADYIRHICRYI
jgi:hypothetical protein